ncbi:MAG: DUF1326 domain-containing protein [Ignavibacteria bacterium]
MKTLFKLLLAALFCLSISGLSSAQPSSPGSATDWSINATEIVACSCTMFCQCYFNTNPDAHCEMPVGGKMRYCLFNEVVSVNKGNYGNVTLDGIKVWMAGNLGDDFSDGEGEWAIVRFEPSTTKEQRDGFLKIFSYVMPLKWKSFTTGEDASVSWSVTKDRAEGKLNGGKSAEIVLKNSNAAGTDPVMIKNLKYLGTPRNDGFYLMPNEIEAYKEGENAFEFKGTSGWMITFDMNSKDVK